jgi:site-specific recombinase XerD
MPWFSLAWSGVMTGDDEPTRDLAALVVPQGGRMVATGDRYEPYRLVDADGVVVAGAAAFFRDLLAAGRSESTVRSYGMDLLRWLRFLRAAGVRWDQATRAEARDFSRWLQVAGKQARPHWRRGDADGRAAVLAAGAYASSVRAHSETVLRAFYDFHLDAGSGPLVNPFPLDRSRRGGRAHAHHNPVEPFRSERSGLYRPRVPDRIPRSVPDSEFNEIFAGLPSHRDRALVAFYVSTGARASELLSATVAGTDPGRQLITVVRKGTRELQELPASTDAFVWLRLYQVEMAGLIPAGRRQPLWWASRRPARPLTYHAVHRMFERVNDRAGTTATLHSLRHTAAYRMAEDPALPLTDVQLVLGHAQLTTTQIYLTPRKEEVIRRVLAHHAEQTRQATGRARPDPAPGYRPEVLDVLFGNGAS